MKLGTQSKKNMWRKGSVRRGQIRQQKFRKRFPQSRQWGPGSGDKNEPPGQATKRLSTTRGQGLGSVEDQRDLWAQHCWAIECLRIPRSSFERQRAKKNLVCGAGGEGMNGGEAGEVSFILGRLQHTGREPQEHRRRSGSHTSGFAFPERGPALPGAGPWLPVPAARSMTGQALP